MKACFETFGRRLSKEEDLQMEANYLAEGWDVTAVRSEADLFVIRSGFATLPNRHSTTSHAGLFGKTKCADVTGTVRTSLRS